MMKFPIPIQLPFVLVLAASLAACSGPTDDIDSAEDPLPTADGSENNGAQGVDDKGEGADPTPSDDVELPDEKAPEEDLEPNDDEPIDEHQTGDVTLTSIHETVFVEMGCTAGYCHGTMGLSDAESVYEAFVDVAAPTPLCGRTHYVVPGEPEESILWLRVRPLEDEDVECEIVKMPAAGTTGLDAETAQLVYDWIADGAAL